MDHGWTGPSLLGSVRTHRKRLLLGTSLHVFDRGHLLNFVLVVDTNLATKFNSLLPEISVFSVPYSSENTSHLRARNSGRGFLEFPLTD